jgi:hypothetical protein
VRLAEEKSRKWSSDTLGKGAAITFALLFGIGGAAAAAAEPEVWLAGVDPVVLKAMDSKATSDYLDLFQAAAPWSRAAANVQVFKTSTQFLYNASNDDLTGMFAGLKRLNIALAFEGLMQTTTDKCGKGVEGYTGSKVIGDIAERIKRLGGDLRYIAMDEPLWFGHHSTGLNACHSTAAEIARDVATKVATVRRYFPNVQVGDIEPVAADEPADWIDEITEWAGAYHAAVGEPLSFLHADVQWTGPWQRQLPLLRDRLHTVGVKFGIIYNGDPGMPSDADWTRLAESRFVKIEGSLGLVPDHAVIQSWMFQPHHYLPDSQPGTLTYLVNRYAARPTTLALTISQGNLSGRLTDAAGNAVSGKAVELSVVDNGKAAVTEVRSIEADVPPHAVYGIFRLRLNTECKCTGPADLTIGTMLYSVAMTGEQHQDDFTPPGLPGTAPGTVTKSPIGVHVTTSPSEKVLLDTAHFPVSEGSSYSFEVPLRASPQSRGSGYIAIVFFTADGHEVQRRTLPLRPGIMPIGKATTGESGSFSFSPNPTISDAHPNYRASFAGTDDDRPSSVVLH